MAVTIDPVIDKARASQYRRKSGSSRSRSGAAVVMTCILQVQVRSRSRRRRSSVDYNELTVRVDELEPGLGPRSAGTGLHVVEVLGGGQVEPYGEVSVRRPEADRVR